MKKIAVLASLTFLLAASQGIHAAPAINSGANDIECQIGADCPIPAADGGAVSYRVNKDMGNDFRCIVFSSGDETRVKVQGDDQFLVFDTQEYIAHPIVTFKVHGEYNHEANYGHFKVQKSGGSDGRILCAKA